MERNWLRIISPCTIAAALSIIPIIIGFAQRDQSEGWSMILVIIFLPLLFALLALSAVIKAMFKHRIREIWLVEAIVVIVSIVILKTHFF